jgi:single-stranded-DNA-specific exonuclease
VRSRDYRGVKEVQIEWLEAHPVERGEIEIPVKRVEISIVDHRAASHPLGELTKLIDKEETIVWAEAEARDRLKEKGITSRDRLSLEGHRGLAIWTTPPGGQVLRAALDLVSPEVIHLFAVDPELDKLEPFIKRLGGLVKYALTDKNGFARISTLAAATAHREVTIRAGIAWLAERGDLQVFPEGKDEIHFAEGDKIKKEGFTRELTALQELLSETAAYRAHFSRAEAELLIDPIFDK